jgi:UDP-N-acetylglucosamine--N-acetylmuramyl-(pentapeptide) pyrophosphoryl-undecaprenol N-acetylglucosamine transferase
MPDPVSHPLIAIACGGTGGHLFPGLAVAEALQNRGCDIQLFISRKEVDQQAVKSAVGMEVIVLPLASGSRSGILFGRDFIKSYLIVRKIFSKRRPQAVLAMGGFACAPPVLAAPFRTPAFLHEANSIPGRANRWLFPWVDQAFVYFPSAAARLRRSKVSVVGMPVRGQFQAMDAAACRMVLGLAPQHPVLLIMGGSQGASGINSLLTQALPALTARLPELQFLHLTGPGECDRVKAAYARLACKSVVRPFLTEMEYALGAATVAVSRAGASSLAEMAAMRLPAILIPYPWAADNHQFRNALAFVDSGAARLVTQNVATLENLTPMILDLLGNAPLRQAMSDALAKWHDPNAAEQIAERIALAVRGGPAPITEAPRRLAPQPGSLPGDRLETRRSPLS